MADTHTHIQIEELPKPQKNLAHFAIVSQFNIFELYLIYS